MKEEKRSKVVLQTVAQLPNHPLVRKAGLFFCQGFKDIRMARSEIFTDESDDIHFSGSPRPSNGLAMTRRIRSCDDDRSSSLRAKRGNLGIFIQDKSLTSYFSKLLPVSKGFMGSLPKDPGQGKKLCGVQKFSVMKGIKKKSIVRTSTLWLSQQAGVLTDRGRAIKPPAVIPLKRSHRQSGKVIVPRPQGE